MQCAALLYEQHDNELFTIVKSYYAMRCTDCTKQDNTELYETVKSYLCNVRCILLNNTTLGWRKLFNHFMQCAELYWTTLNWTVENSQLLLCSDCTD